MPLVALRDNERVTSMELDYAQRASYTRGMFLCPECEREMHLKLFKRTQTQFFAHYRGGDCAHGRGESQAHLYLKQMVYEAAIYCGWDAQLEQRCIVDGKVVVMDVALHKHNWKRAVEIQLSRQDSDTYIERTDVYKQLGYATLWLTRHKTANRLKRHNVRAVRLLPETTDMKRLPELNAYLKGNLIVKVNRPIIGKREPQMETLDAVSFLKGFLQEGLTFLRDFDYTATIRMDEWGNLSKHIKTLENVWVTHDEYEHAQKEIDDMQKELDRRIKAQELREHDETLQREKESEGEAFAKHFRTMVCLLYTSPSPRD